MDRIPTKEVGTDINIIYKTFAGSTIWRLIVLSKDNIQETLPKNTPSLIIVYGLYILLHYIYILHLYLHL